MLRWSKKLSMRGSQSSGARSLAERTPGGPKSSGKCFIALNSKRGSQPSGRCSRAGMTKTWTCGLHKTDREGCRQVSNCVVLPQLAGRVSLCPGVSSGSDGRTEKRRKRDESLDKVVVLFAELVWRGLGGILRNQDTVSSMLPGSAERCKGQSKGPCLRKWDWFRCNKCTPLILSSHELCHQTVHQNVDPSPSKRKSRTGN